MALKIVEREVIKDDAITAAKVEDGTVVTADLTTNFITNAHVKSDAAIATSKITGLATSATTDTTDADNITSGTLPTARLDTGTTANKIVLLDGNAKLPAISGASLTGIESATVSTSDPVIATNPSGGVGTKWINKTSGEVYICTDATAGANVWTNVGAGSGDVQPWAFQGESYGYTSGGWPNPPATDVIDKFSFTTDGNAVDVGNLTLARTMGCGHTSVSYGWTSGGRGTGWGTLNNNIDKFSFSSDGNATDSGDLLTTWATGAGHSSTTHGYIAGGEPSGSSSNSIQKFAFVSGGNASAISGVLTFARLGCCGVSAESYGYTIGGQSPYSNVIEKMNFSTDANATDVGDLSIARNSFAGTSSSTEGFVGGGGDAGTPPGANQIEKWSFASDANATSHGNLSREAYGVCGQSATSYGYTSGGYVPNTYSNIIDKYAYTSNTTATDVGNLTVARGDRPHGHQV